MRRLWRRPRIATTRHRADACQSDIPMSAFYLIALIYAWLFIDVIGWKPERPVDDDARR